MRVTAPVTDRRTLRPTDDRTRRDHIVMTQPHDPLRSSRDEDDDATDEGWTAETAAQAVADAVVEDLLGP